MMMMHGELSAVHGLAMIVIAVIVVVPFWRICTKAGYAGWWSLLVVFPVANLVFLYVLAFSHWPSRPEAGRGRA